MRHHLRVQVVENMACFTQIIVSLAEATKYFIAQIETEFLLRHPNEDYIEVVNECHHLCIAPFLCTLRECFNSATKTVPHSAEPTKTNKQGPEAELR